MLWFLNTLSINGRALDTLKLGLAGASLVCAASGVRPFELAG
jgi:hypothetical protein